MPYSLAVSADRLAPARTSWYTFFTYVMRLEMYGMDVVATAPSFVSLMAKKAPFTDTTKSHAHTKPTAAPMADPCMSAMVYWWRVER